jgi:DNA-directed RNA polymerase subunit K/omega
MACAKRILVQDAGRPFQAQLSRSAGRRARAVRDPHSASIDIPKGDPVEAAHFEEETPAAASREVVQRTTSGDIAIRMEGHLLWRAA